MIATDSPLLFENSLRSVLHSWEVAGSLGDSELIRAAGAYGSKPVLWSVLPDTGKSRLAALLERCEIDMLIDERFFVCGAPSDERFAKKFSEIVSELSAEQANRAIKQSTSRRPFVRLAIDRVGCSASFRGAEENLRLVELCSENLEREDVVHLREAIQSNPRDQVRLAAGTKAILSSIYSASSPTEASRVEWCVLAEWLHAQGVEKDDDDYYLYNEFLELVRAGD